MFEDLKVAACAELIKKADSIAVLTGAGISTAAGIPDFRGPKGLYVTKRYDADKIFDINYFYQDPKPFFDFARDFLTLEEKIKPTFTHQFLVHLEQLGKLKGIVTQNIDSLHQLAGSKNVYEMHGSFWQSHCLHCDQKYDFKTIKQLIEQVDVPRCSCKGVIKPDVVFFGEDVKYYRESVELAECVDLFFIIGTSCVVYPAASLPSFVRGQIVVVNQSKIKLPLNNIVLEVQENMDDFFSRVSTKLKN